MNKQVVNLPRNKTKYNRLQPSFALVSGSLHDPAVSVLTCLGAAKISSAECFNLKTPGTAPYDSTEDGGHEVVPRFRFGRALTRSVLNAKATLLK